MRRTSHSVIGVCLKSQGNHSSTAVPTCLLDNFFLNRRGDTDILTVLNFLHCPSVASLVQCCDKGPANHVVQAVTPFMDFLVLKRICLRTDGELASGSPAQAIKIARNDETPLETTSRFSSSSLGAVEIALEKSADKSCGIEDHILVWLCRHAVWPVTRFHIKFAPFFWNTAKVSKV